ENFKGARLLRVPVAPGDLAARMETFARAVHRQVESEEYALVHFTDPLSGQVLCDQRAHRGYRIVYDASRSLAAEAAADTTVLPDVRRFLSKVRRQELSCLMAADAVVAASPLTRKYLESMGVLPNTIQLLRTPAGLGSIPRPLPTQGTGLRIVYVGSVEAWQ